MVKPAAFDVRRSCGPAAYTVEHKDSKTQELYILGTEMANHFSETYKQKKCEDFGQKMLR